MRLCFLSIIIIAVIWLTQHFSQYISFSYNKVVFNFPTWIVIITILIISYVYVWLFQLALNNWLKFKQLHKFYEYGRRSFYHLMTEQPYIAEKFALKIANNEISKFLGLLLAANAAKQQSCWENALKYLIKAEILAEQEVGFIKKNSYEIATLGIIKADIYYCQKEYQKCILELKKLLINFPKHKTLLIKLIEIYRDTQEWVSLIELLPLLKKSKIYNNYDYQELEIDFYKNRLEQIANTCNPQMNISINQYEDDLINFFDKLPKHLRRNSLLNLIYISYLMKFKNNELAEKVLQIYLNTKSNEWSSRLVKLYGFIKTNDPAKQIKIAERWLNLHREDPNLLLTLGRLCMQANLTGKAKTYLEKALSIEKSPECYAELGRLFQLTGDNQKSFFYYQKSLLETTPLVTLQPHDHITNDI